MRSGLTCRPRHLEKGGLTSQTNAERLVGLEEVPPGQNRRALRRRLSEKHTDQWTAPAPSASFLTHGQTWCAMTRTLRCSSATEHPDVDKETLREALHDTVRHMIRGAPRRTESDDNSWKEVLSDLAPKLPSKKGKTGSSEKKPKP